MKKMGRLAMAGVALALVVAMAATWVATASAEWPPVEVEVGIQQHGNISTAVIWVNNRGDFDTDVLTVKGRVPRGARYVDSWAGWGQGFNRGVFDGDDVGWANSGVKAGGKQGPFVYIFDSSTLPPNSQSYVLAWVSWAGKVPGTAVSKTVRIGAEQRPPVVLGVVSSIAGIKSSVGLAMKQGIELAVEGINARGGIDGRKIEVIIEDDETSPDKAAAATTKLIKEDGVTAVLGAAVSPTMWAAARVANAERVVIFSPTLPGDQLTAPGSGMDYVFRIGLPDRLSLGKGIAHAAKSYNRIGLLTYAGEIGASSTAAATKHLTDLGKPPVATVHYNPLAPDVTPQLRQLQRAGAEAIVAQGVPEDAATIAKGMKQIGYGAQVVGHLSFCDPLVRALALDEAQGAYCIDSVDSGKPEAQKLMDAHKKKYGGGELTYWLPVLHGYDSVMVMAEALRRADFDGSRLKDAMESITDFPAVSGGKDNTIGFGPGQHDGNRENAVLLKQIRGKDLILVE